MVVEDKYVVHEVVVVMVAVGALPAVVHVLTRRECEGI